MAFGFFRNNSNNNQANNIHSPTPFGHTTHNQTPMMGSIGRMPSNSGAHQAHQAQAMRGHRPQQAIQARQNMPAHAPQQARQIPHQQQVSRASMPQQNNMLSQAARAQMPPHPQIQQRPQATGRNSGQLPRLTNNAIENPFSAPLPDGVKLVPLDESTMKNLYSAGANPPAGTQPPTASRPAQSATTPAQPADQVSAPIQQTFDNPIAASSPAAVESLAKFIQNERNGTVFYSNLARMTHSQEFQDRVAKISENCSTRREKLDKAYFEQRMEAFSPEQSTIEHSATFTDGLRFAIAQEAAAIQELGHLHETNTNPALCKLIDSQIYSKIADIAILNLMLSHK